MVDSNYQVKLYANIVGKQCLIVISSLLYLLFFNISLVNKLAV